MRDIRRPYRSLSSNNSSSVQPISRRNKEKTLDEKSHEVEMFEKREYKDIIYNKDGIPVMKADTHFDIAGLGKRRQREKDDEYDVLKRDSFFSNKKRDFDEEDINNFRKSKNKKGKVRRTILYFFISLIALALILWTFVFDSATVTINPKYKDVDVSDTFVFFKEDLAIDYSGATLSKDVMKSAPKEVNQKAEGDIVVYNNYSTNPQILIKNTRFQTKDGKIFRTKDSVTIPGKNGDNPGSVVVKVTSDSYGSDYNISATDFTIPGFKGTPRYTAFYGKSTSTFIGGASGTISVVSPEDIAIANSDLKPKINSDLSDSVKNFNHEDYFSLYKSLILNYTDNQNDLITSNQNKYNLSATATLVSIKKQVLANYIAKQVLQGNYDPSQNVHIDDISKLNFTVDPNIDLNNTNVVKILITGKARIIWTYGQDNVKNILLGQKTSSFPGILNKNFSAIIDSKLKVSPPWIRVFPSNVKQINVLEVLK